jgi:hypothetical protein
VDSRRTCGAVALVGVAVVVAMAGCSSGTDRPPGRLVDGTTSKAPSVRLDAPNPQILTAVASIEAKEALAGTAAGECLRAAREHPASDPVVVRTGVAGISATFTTASGRALVACDGDHALRAENTSWCGRAYGRLARGRLLDPRLDLAGCRTSAGDTIAFAWFTPGRDTAYVAVQQKGYTEVYPVARRLPVRVTTDHIAPDRSGATFEMSEHGPSGALLRSSTLEARVAG